LRESRISPDGVVLQTHGSTCAAAAAASVARRLGAIATEADMTRLLGTTDDGTSDAQIVYGFAKINLVAVRRKVSDRDIRKVQAPALLLTSPIGAPNGHCVAFMGMQGDKAEIWDPGSGRTLQSVQEVRERWPGWAFQVTRHAAAQ